MKVRRYKKEDDVTYSLGATVTLEYLMSKPAAVDAVILSPDLNSDEVRDKVEAACSQNGIPVSTDAKAFNILSPKENCFVIGIIRKDRQTIGEGDHVVLVNPSNAGNLGTIIRTCVGFGIRDIAVIRPCTDPFDPKTIRSSMGAAAKVSIEMFDSYDQYEERFGGNNKYPFMLDGSTLLQETKIVKPFSLIMGNEATGLPGKFRDVGHPIRIEHTSGIDSLNLPIATSIGLYEATRDSFSS